MPKTLRYLWCSILVVACNSTTTLPETGRARFVLTDAPLGIDDISAVNVHLVAIDIAMVVDSMPLEWITVAAPDQEYELLSLQQGAVALLGDAELPAGEYNALRVKIDSERSSVRWNDGTEAAVLWAGEGVIEAHALVEEPLAVGEDPLEIVLDFDVGRSIQVLSDTFNLGGVQQIAFYPWIRAVDRAATGSLTGRVLGTRSGGDTPEPVPNAFINISREYDFPDSVGIAYQSATGYSDEAGAFAAHFLTAGRYTVQAIPPPGDFPGFGYERHVEIERGVTTEITLTLTQNADTIPSGGGR